MRPFSPSPDVSSHRRWQRNNVVAVAVSVMLVAMLSWCANSAHAGCGDYLKPIAARSGAMHFAILPSDGPNALHRVALEPQGSQRRELPMPCHGPNCQRHVPPSEAPVPSRSTTSDDRSPADLIATVPMDEFPNLTVSRQPDVVGPCDGVGLDLLKPPRVVAF